MSEVTPEDTAPKHSRQWPAQKLLGDLMSLTQDGDLRWFQGNFSRASAHCVLPIELDPTAPHSLIDRVQVSIAKTATYYSLSIQMSQDIGDEAVFYDTHPLYEEVSALHALVIRGSVSCSTLWEMVGRSLEEGAFPDEGYPGAYDEATLKTTVDAAAGATLETPPQEKPPSFFDAISTSPLATPSSSFDDPEHRSETGAPLPAEGGQDAYLEDVAATSCEPIEAPREEAGIEEISDDESAGDDRPRASSIWPNEDWEALASRIARFQQDVPMHA